MIWKLALIIVIQCFLAANAAYSQQSSTTNQPSRSLFKDKRVDYDALKESREKALQEKEESLKGKEKAIKPIRPKQTQIALKSATLKDISTIYIPEKLGRVVEVYQAPQNERLIIHIQDLHTNPEGQLNSAGILDILIKDYGLELVCSEGAEGIVDTSSVSGFPDAEVREKTARLFIDSGELTGEEYLSITKYPDLPIWGVEDKDLYFENIVEFNKIMKFQERSNGFINQVKETLEALKPKIYSKRLLEIDAKQNDYTEAKLDTKEYIDYLVKLHPELEQEEKYKNIYLLRETAKLEKDMDQEKIKVDSERLLLDLEKALKENKDTKTLEALFMKASLFKEQKMAPFSFYGYIKDLAEKNLGDKLTQYANVFRFVDYLSKVNSLDSIKLFNEIDELTYEIKALESINEKEKLLTEAMRHIKLLDDFFKVKLSNEELDYYYKDKGSFTVGWFKSAIETLGGGVGIDFDPDALDLYLPSLEHFYDIADKRDAAMVKNAINEILRRDAKVAAFISGGFHTRGITGLFKEKGYSYIIISPYSSSEIDEENYKFLLSGKRRPLSELIGQLDEKK